MIDEIEQLQQRILSAATFPAITTALISVEKAIISRETDLINSGNKTDKAIVQIEGEIRLLKTLKHVGNSRVDEIKENRYRANQENYKIVKAAETILDSSVLEQIKEAARK